MDPTASDIGDRGELWLASEARGAGMSATKTGTDRHGWDYLIEVPADAVGLDHPLDLRPAEITCKIQVKTFHDKRVRESIKLDNFARLAKADMPCFYAMVGLGTENDVTSVHLVHVDRNWVETVFRRLRELPADERKRSHKHTLDVTWNDDVRLAAPNGRELRTAILTHVRDGMDAYVKAKQSWKESVGYANDSYRVRFTIDGDPGAATWARMSDFAIGLERRLPITQAIVERERFGVRDLVRHHRDGGHIEIQHMKGSSPATVRLSTPDRAAVLRCEVLTTWSLFPDLPKDHQRANLRSPFFSLVLGSETTECQWNLSDDVGPQPLSMLVNAGRALRMLATADRVPVSIEYTAGAISGRFDWSAGNVLPSDAVELLDAIDAAASVTRGFGILEDPRWSIAQIFKGKSALMMLARAFGGDAKGIEIGATPNKRGGGPARVALAILLPVKVAIGDEVYASIVAVTADMDPARRDPKDRQIVLGTAVRIEHGRLRVVARAAAGDLPLEQDTVEMEKRLGDSGVQTLRWKDIAESSRVRRRTTAPPGRRRRS